LAYIFPALLYSGRNPYYQWPQSLTSTSLLIAIAITPFEEPNPETQKTANSLPFRIVVVFNVQVLAFFLFAAILPAKKGNTYKK